MASTSTTLVYFCIITFRELASILDVEKSVINLIIKYSQRLLSYMYLKCVQICMFARKFEWNSSSFVPFPHIMWTDYESAGFGFCGGFKNTQTSCFLHRNDADIKTEKTHTQELRGLIFVIVTLFFRFPYVSFPLFLLLLCNSISSSMHLSYFKCKQIFLLFYIYDSHVACRCLPGKNVLHATLINK